MLQHKNFTKITPTEVDWKILYEVVANCNKSHNPRSYGVDVLENIGRICPFQQGLVYLIDANHHLMGHYLKNIEEHFNKAYSSLYTMVFAIESAPFPCIRNHPANRHTTS